MHLHICINVAKNKRQQKLSSDDSVITWRMVILNQVVAVKHLKASKPMQPITIYLKFLFMNINYKARYSFIYGNSPIHVSKDFKECNPLKSDWSAKLPDLNIMENVWKIIYNIVSFKWYLSEMIHEAVLDINIAKREITWL